MDEQRFDALVRRMASACSRRPLFGALAGALLTGMALPESALACKKVGRKCDKNKDCCDHATCKGDKKDKKGKCRCKGRFTACNKQCYDLDKDENHCGSCDIRCEVGAQICDNGRCVNVPS